MLLGNEYFKGFEVCKKENARGKIYMQENG